MIYDTINVDDFCKNKSKPAFCSVRVALQERSFQGPCLQLSNHKSSSIVILFYWDDICVLVEEVIDDFYIQYNTQREKSTIPIAIDDTGGVAVKITLIILALPRLVLVLQSIKNVTPL